MGSVIEKARSHFADAGMRHIDIPEWGEVNSPLRIYYPARLSVAVRRRCWRDEHGAVVDGQSACVRAMLNCAQNVKGERLFDPLDEHALMHEVDSEIVGRIGGAILGFVSGEAKPAEDSVEDAKKP